MALNWGKRERGEKRKKKDRLKVEVWWERKIL